MSDNHLHNVSEPALSGRFRHHVPDQPPQEKVSRHPEKPMEKDRPRSGHNSHNSPEK